MPRIAGFASAALAAVLLVCGCLPDGTPAYIEDGRTIILMANDSSGEPALWTCDVKTRTATSYPAPDDLLSAAATAPSDKEERYPPTLKSVRVFDNQVWTTWRADAQHSLRFDPARKRFLPDGPAVDVPGWAAQAFPAGQKGKKCLFMDTGDGFLVLSFPDLKKIEGDWIESPVPAGDFWWVDYGRNDTLSVYDATGKIACSISDTAVKAVVKERGGGYPVYARIGGAGKVVLIVFQVRKQQYFNLGVFDTSNGQLLWSVAEYYGPKYGVPLVTREAVWLVDANDVWLKADPSSTRPADVATTFPATTRSAASTSPAGTASTAPAVSTRPTTTAPSRQRAVTIVRYTQAGREVVANLPIGAEDELGQFAPSPDGSHFLVVVNAKPSRLLFVPIKAGVTGKGIKVIELVDRK